MNEFELIAKLTGSLATNSSVVAGAGDDCAVLENGRPGYYLLLKTDAVVEGIHFTAEAEPEQIGHKALGRCLSDIAAMAGTPLAAVVTIALPKDFKTEFVERVYHGINRLAERSGAAIVGGETTTSPERMLLSIAVLGEVPRDKCILRSGAKEGDALFVSGELGGAIAEKHLTFEPRLAEAQWLAANFAIHAMIDLSDGLAGDLPHILHRSNVGAELMAQAIPISRAAKLEARAHPSVKTPLLAALSDGEDFELLFAAPSHEAVAILDGWKEKFPQVRLSCIGRITKEPGLKIRDKTGLRPLNAHGYVHFA
ncbi:MAG: thiamine-phosphate kinase [Limisphaerales bacterium]